MEDKIRWVGSSWYTFSLYGWRSSASVDYPNKRKNWRSGCYASNWPFSYANAINRSSLTWWWITSLLKRMVKWWALTEREGEKSLLDEEFTGNPWDSGLIV
jgi:hypothetical protein